MCHKKVAVIAVHGVAEQRPGETAQALVQLMVGADIEGATYEGVGQTPLTLRVRPLQPQDASVRRDASQPDGRASPPKDSAWKKAWRHSWWSGLVGPGALAPGQAPRADSGVSLDLGRQLTNYLLAKHVENEVGHEAYETSVTHLRRTQGSDVKEVDMYEMYWADLSRLSGSVPRIVGEAFTFVFRLSQLGRDTVDFARRVAHESLDEPDPRSRAWATVCWTQRCLNWCLSNVLGVLALQLILCGGLLLLLGLARQVLPSSLDALFLGIPVVASFLGLCVLVYLSSAPTPAMRRLRWFLLAILAALMLLVVCQAPMRAHVSLALLLGIVAVALHVGLKAASERFPFAYFSGMATSVGTLLLMWAVRFRDSASKASGPDGVAAVEHWMQGALFAFDAWLHVFKWSWVGFAVIAVIWWLAGMVVAWRRDYRVKASVVTGRLGMVVSTVALLMVTMSLWALMTQPLHDAVGPVLGSDCAVLRDNICYHPLSFGGEPSKAMYAMDFLNERFRQSTDAFFLIFLMLLSLLIWLLFVLVPSVLAEMKLLMEDKRLVSRKKRSKSPEGREARHRQARQLGRWLTQGYHFVDAITQAVTVPAIVCGLLFAAVYAQAPLPSSLMTVLMALSSDVLGWLQGALIGVTGLAAMLVAFGGLLSKHAPSLRGPLDIALDVDNYFREFPRTAIPRARIFSRYAALLQHVELSGQYSHIVVVAHSQGTVISADLFRHLRVGGCAQASAPLRLLTLGSPLRQLYAARFPMLYRWVLGRRNGTEASCVFGPSAADIGVERWFNAFTSGDYVGRWLWCKGPTGSTEASSHPCDDEAEGLGRVDAYGRFDPMPPDRAALDGLREAETCLGIGAHTHYFEPGQQTVAWLTDYLVIAPPC